MRDPIYVRIKIINDSDFDVEFWPAIDGCSGSGTLSLTTAAGQWMIPRTELREISCVTSRRSVLRPHSRITNFNETSSGGFQLVPGAQYAELPAGLYSIQTNYAFEGTIGKRHVCCMGLVSNKVAFSVNEDGR